MKKIFPALFVFVSGAVGRVVVLSIALLLTILTVTYVYNEFVNRPLCKDCNVILVSLDTLGSNHLPCYGYERNTAPNLCKFAKENIMFTNSYSNAPWTLPSHFSIFTSLYPSHHGMMDTSIILDNEISTLTQILREGKYETVYVGPKDDIQLPLEKGLGRGFKETIGSPDAANMDSWSRGLEILKGNNEVGKKTFLFLHTYAVHAPYVVEDFAKDKNRLYTNDHIQEIPLTTEDFSKYSSEDFKRHALEFPILSNQEKKKLIDISPKDIPPFLNQLPQYKRYSLKYSYYFEQLKKHDPSGEYSKALYDETIYYLDKSLASLFDFVIKSELSKNTILIITSDHGEEFMEHGYLGHPADKLYNTTTSVPLIIYIPGVKHRQVDSLVEGVDIFPTVLSMVGISYNDSIDGVDLTGQILAKNNTTKSFIISQGRNINSIRNYEWKFHESLTNFNNSAELYNMLHDVEERSNVLPSNTDVSASMSSILKKVLYGEINKDEVN